MNLRDRFVAAVRDEFSDREIVQCLEKRARHEADEARMLRQVERLGRLDLANRVRDHGSKLRKLDDELLAHLHQGRELMTGGFHGEMAHEAAARAKAGVVIRLPGEQLAAFVGARVDPHADHSQWLRSPFPAAFLAPDQPFRASFGDRLVRGVIIWELDHAAIRARAVSRGEHEEWMRGDVSWGPVQRCVVVACHIPIDAWQSYVEPILLAIKHDGTLWLSEDGASNDCHHWAAHVLYYLTSPSVKLVQHSPDPALCRAARKRGRPVPSGWYEIDYHQTGVVRGAISEKGVSRRVRYRFDVRGHFCTFRVGKLAGRTIWRRPHQRGVKNALYVPKGYRITSGVSA